LPCSRELAQQEEQLARSRELRRRAETAPATVERHREFFHGTAQHGRRRNGISSTARANRAEPLDDRLRGLLHFVAFVAPHARDLFEDLRKTGTTPSRRWWKVRAAVERPQRGREPDAHRPAARSRGGLHEGHVHAIDIRTFFAVDLDRYEMTVED